ncbi:dTMP kinase [Sulfurospirillum barnesii]|uniref:Thymidylate kinase n=1 Tax=Sulfurospirillum barnesii (strain ATCC 700032 / DSM 10660 / SES-3) TaxID=760154 RepID=I3XXD5_SULBS|nr:dTMP kinase [Sulfurospirillum barnesii]AFL68609.1 thymidylate kinase [Sulfurospirillum barnesii SES-3]
MYVIFEGVDTTGKSTQVSLFAQSNKNVLATKEPGGTHLGTKLREILLGGELKGSFNAELFLFLADRAFHYDTVVKPMRTTHLVISDRGFLSGIAYACANHSDIDGAFLLQMNRLALEENYPEKIVLFLTNEALIKERLGAKEHDAIEERGVSYLLQIQDIMRRIVKTLPIQVLEVDASQSIETIYRQIEEFLND